jgi:hypothetical protein
MIYLALASTLALAPGEQDAQAAPLQKYLSCVETWARARIDQAQGNLVASEEARAVCVNLEAAALAEWAREANQPPHSEPDDLDRITFRKYVELQVLNIPSTAGKNKKNADAPDQ